MKRTAAALLALSMLVLSGCIFLFLGPEVLYEETFTGDTVGQWVQQTTETISKYVEDGQYHVRFLGSNAMYTSSRNLEQGPFADVQLDLDVTHISGQTELCAAGMLLRAADWDNFYYFLISPAGTYTIGKEVGGTVTTLVAWTSTDAAYKGAATNHLTVRADGATLTFLINGAQVQQLVDASIASGDVGIRAQIYNGATNAHMAFDNIVVTELE